MAQYNMLEANSNLSKICKMFVEKEEDYVVIASNGNPLVKIISYKKEIFGSFRGIIKYDDKFDIDSEEISKMFENR